MAGNALTRRAREAHEWLMDACFPLWAGQGVGPDGAFLEALDMKGRPVKAEIGRVRVQGRQVYVFAAARRFGWSPTEAEHLVRLGINVLSGRCRRPDGLFGRRIGPDGGGLVDTVADLYDTAFALHAMGHAISVLPDRDEPKQLALETHAALRQFMTDPLGGFAEALPRPPYRLQNPHMHLLEAALELNRAEPDGPWKPLAEELHTLFARRLFDPVTGTLGEQFGPDWLRLSGDRDDIIEPGHHFEWVWLLHQRALAADAEILPAARALYDFAVSTLTPSGHPAMTVRRSGAIVDASRRTWVQTEALKAHLTMARLGDETAEIRAAACFDQLMDEHLTSEGGWRDHLEADGSQRGDTMPTSTGYHVVLALEELIGYCIGSRQT